MDSLFFFSKGGNERVPDTLGWLFPLNERFIHLFETHATYRIVQVPQCVITVGTGCTLPPPAHPAPHIHGHFYPMSDDGLHQLGACLFNLCALELG